MSLIDFQISQSVWNAKLPIKISFNKPEILEYGSKACDPIYLELPRCSYIPLLTSRIQKLLADLDIQIPEEDFDSAWYECESEPLKWHYPVGLLYDLEYQNITLPWSLTIRFKNFPSSTLLAKPTPTTMQNMYMSMIKEAEFLRTGNTKKVMNLSKHDQIQLWQSLSLANRHVPVRLYLPDNCPVVQELVSFHQENSEKESPRTVAETVTKMIPELIGKDIVVVAHGIHLPLETPIHWAHVNLSFADNFLHLVIAIPTKS